MQNEFDEDDRDNKENNLFKLLADGNTEKVKIEMNYFIF